jgi:hypothetical protein
MLPSNHLSPSKPVSTVRQGGLSGTEVQFTARELAILGVAGVVAVLAVAFVQTPLRIPGHAVLKAALPLACGMAFVGKPLAGTVTGSASLFTAAALMLAGFGNLQAAALVSLLLVGPALDWARRDTQINRFGWFPLFAFAGLAVNLAAFVVRWGTAFWQADGWHPLNFRTLGSAAMVSFAVCGIVAGVICGAICRERKPQ